MSRGMQQKRDRACIFTAPIVLLLDELTTGSIQCPKVDVANFVNELRDKHDATIPFTVTTHDMDVKPTRFCDVLPSSTRDASSPARPTS